MAVGTPSPIVRPKRGLSLRSKAFLFMCVAIIIAVLGCMGAFAIVMIGAFSRLQDDLVLQRVERVLRRFDEEATALRSFASRRARADALFFDLQTQRIAELSSDRLPLPEDQHDWLVFAFNRQKNLVSAARANGVGAHGPDGEFPVNPEAFRGSGMLDAVGVVRILVTEDSLWIIASEPVLRSSGQGPSPGWLVYAAELRSSWIDALPAFTGILSLAMAPRMGDADHLLATMTSRLGQCRVYGHPAGALDRREITLEFAESFGGGPGRLHISLPTTVYAAALELRDQLVLMAFGGGLLLTLMSFLCIEFLFIRRIKRMDADLQRIAATEDASARLDASGTDEFGRLARSTNRLLEALRRRRSEAEMQQKLLASVMDSAIEGIMAFRAQRGADGEIEDFVLVMSNAAADRIFGEGSGIAVGGRLRALFPEPLADALHERYVRVVESRRGDNHEFVSTRDGHEMWLHSSANSWGDGLVVTYEEITARKHTEEELQQHLSEIERFNRAMIGREERILQMKTEVNELRARLALPPAYTVDMNTDDS